MTETAPRTLDAQEPEPERVDAARLGERLGRYQLVLPLAQGGMGLVFAGRLLGAHGVERLVAIKTLRPITSSSDRAALLREAKLTARLHHRNVVATLDLGEVDDVPYVVMELVDGVSLARLLSELSRRRERLAPELAAWIVMQAALGLHAAHELPDPEGKPLGLVHRDISPQNILLSLQGEVKIADFGIAKYTGREESTATGMIKGKFGYMSPEQAQSGELDRTSDIFALGIVFWEALTGERLFAAETPARTILRVMEHRPRSPADVRPEVGNDLAAIVLGCLAKDPGSRYSTAARLADDIRSVLRARAAPVDEGDLSALVRDLFGAERAKTMDRIRTEGLTETETATAAVPGEASGLVAVSVNAESDRGAPASPPRRRWPLVVVAAALLGAVATFAWTTRVTPAAAPISTATTAPTPSVAASSSATSEPAPTPSASIASPSPPASGKPATTAPPRVERPRAPVRGAKAAVAPPPVAPAPAPPPPKATTGQPFESL